MKKFTIHPADAQIGRWRPRQVERPDVGPKTYGKLMGNPLYWYHAIQYRGGDFYRAVLGAEVLWDLRREEILVKCLDYYLHKLWDDGLYYYETAIVSYGRRFYGLIWPSGVKPPLDFSLQWSIKIPANEPLLARVNKLDSPAHVDLERPNGEVFTVPLPYYENLVERGALKIKKGKKDYESPSVKRKGKGLGMVKRSSLEEPTQTMAHRLPRLRQRFGRAHTLQKASTRV